MSKGEGMCRQSFGAALVTCLICSLCLHAGSVSADTSTFGEGDVQFAIEFVKIGAPGNENDPRVRLSQPLGSEGFDVRPSGGVDYVYSISKFEISLDIVKFVDEVAGLGVRFGGYDRLTPAGPIVPRDEMPALVSWIEAARVVNWLNTSQGYHPAYKFQRQPGDEFYKPAAANQLWTEGEVGYDPENLFRNSLARYAIPTLDEWHKAAYYDPRKNNGMGGYWLYATGSDDAPVAVASGTDPGTSVYGLDLVDGPADVDKAGGLSSFGVMGMGGNAKERTENNWDGTYAQSQGLRDIRAGRWDDRKPASADMNITESFPPGTDLDGVGFRVVDLQPSILVVGDFDGNGLLTAADIDLLSEHIASMSSDVRFDITKDGLVNELDRAIWVESIVGTHFGDADLNRRVDFVDFLRLSNNFGADDTGWAEGDFTGNGSTELDDFLLLADNFGAVHEASASPVPEPTSLRLIALGFLVVLRVRDERSRNPTGHKSARNAQTLKG